MSDDTTTMQDVPQPLRQNLVVLHFGLHSSVVFLEGYVCHCDNSERLPVPPNLAATNETHACLQKCYSVSYHSLEDSVEDLQITSKRFRT